MNVSVEQFKGVFKRQIRMLPVVLIVLAVIVTYMNTLHVPFIMDDETISSFARDNLLDILRHRGARSITDVTFALNYQLHGIQVTGYHLVNLLVHMAASLTLYALVTTCFTALRQTFPTPETSGPGVMCAERFMPLAAALLFAVHPLQTQAVTYIIQRYTSLATLFYLLSALFFIKARVAHERGNRRGAVWGAALVSVLAGILALGSKQIAFTLPVMLIVLELFLFRGRMLNRRFYIISGGLGVIVLAALLFAWSNGSLADLLYDLHLASAEDTHISRFTYFLTQTRVVVTYLRLLLFPYGQSLIHSSPVYSKLLTAPVIASLAVHAALFVSAAFLFKLSGRNLGSGAGDDRETGMIQRLAALGIVWFYVALTIESSFFPIRDVIFEHRLYLPSVGFCLLLTAGMSWGLRGCRAGARQSWSLLALVVVVLSCLTVARNQVWNDALDLYLDAATKSPDNTLALVNLGDEYLLRNMPDKAVPLLVRAIELKPDLDAYSKVYLGEALQQLQLSTNRFTTGKEFILPDGGVSDYRFAGIAFNNLGLAYEFLGKPEKALESYRKSLLVIPEYDLAWYNLGLLAFRQHDKHRADIAITQLKRLNPALAQTLMSTIQR